MVLDPKKTFYDDMRFIQRDVQADLPALNESGSPELGTVCRLNNGDFWVVVADDLDPNNLLIWQKIGGGGGTSLPDQRFTVAKAAYNLNPPNATLTTIPNGVAAALAGTDTTLGPASVTSQRFVWVMPDSYADNVTLRPYVHIEGSGPSQAAKVTGNLTYGSGSGYVVIRNLHLSGTISIAPTNGSTVYLIFDDCTFENVTWSLTTPGGDAPTQVFVVFAGCTGSITNATSTIGGGDTETHYIYGKTSTGTGQFAGNRGITFANTPVWTGAGSAVVFIGGGQRLTANGGGGPMLQFAGSIGGSVVTEDCLLNTANIQASVFGNTSNNNLPAEWVCRAGTKVTITPRSYWSTTTAAKFTGGQLEILIPTTNDASAPLDPIAGGSVTAELYPSNRERFVQPFSFAVPSSQYGGGGPYANAAAAIDAMTINLATATNAYADEYRIVCTYPNLNGDPNDPDSANFATTFRFASFVLKEPSFLEDGRMIVVKNDTNPLVAGAGPFALRIPNGSAGNVEHKISESSINGVFDSTNYVILQPGQAVILSVDRQTAYAPAYTVISVVDALPGIPPAPDQRFTVGKAAYALNAPGTNTFISPEDGIAAAQAGTGTALGVASAASQRLVWIMPDTYAAPLKAVDLIPYVHLEGSSGSAESTILSGYALQYLLHGHLSLTGLQFTNCVLNLTPDDDSTIFIVGCHFSGSTINLSAAQGKTTTVKMVGCSGTLNLVHNSTGTVKIEISGTSPSTQSSGVSLTASESVLYFTNPIQCIGGGSTYMLVASGAYVRYGGLYLASAVGSTLFITTSSASVECAIGSSSIFSATNVGYVYWQALAGTHLTGSTVTTFFDVDATSQAAFEGAQITQEPINTSIVSRLLDPVSGGTVQSTGLGSGIIQRLNYYDITVIPGQTVAQQTKTYEDGYADYVTVVANYQGSAPLQPDTTLAGRCFASLIIPDPLYVPEGKEITISNRGNPASGQSAFAIRLPNGSTSTIGNKVSVLTSNPVFSPDNYYILYPGQSIKLIAIQSLAVPPRYEVTSIYAPQPPQEPSWLDEAMGQYAVLPVTVAGSNTTGTLFFARRTGVYCNGGRFYWGGAVARTIRVTLWKSGVGAVATVDVAVAGAGIYTGRFASPYPIDGASNWFITFWETTGAEYQFSSSIPNGTLRYPSGIQQREYQYITIIRGDVFGGGNAIPNLGSGPTTYYLIEPLISVFSV